MTRIVYAWEPLMALRDDGLAEVVRSHWDEVGVHKDKMPLSVDWARYERLEKEGILKVMGARRGEELVGYSSFLVMPHLHYSSTLHAHNDAVYVKADVRGVGIGLIRESERLLAEIAKPGWVRVIYHAKTHVEEDRGTFRPVFERLGYSAFETTLDKMVRATDIVDSPQ